MRIRAVAVLSMLVAGATFAVGCASDAADNAPVARTETSPTRTAPSAVATAATQLAPTSDRAAPASTTPACAPPYPSGPATAETVLCADPASMQAAQVLRIVDGDTLHVSLDGRDETVRLFGINAREVGQPCSTEATARLRELAGQEVRLRPDARDRDRYGRLLRYVYTAQGLSVDAEVTAEGLAYAWRADGVLRRPIIELEQRAEAAHRGCLWP